MSENGEGAAEVDAPEYHHGRTPAAWAGSLTAAVAFILGAIGAVTGPNWTLVWLAGALLLTAVVAGGILRRNGYGQS